MAGADVFGLCKEVTITGLKSCWITSKRYFKCFATQITCKSL